MTRIPNHAFLPLQPFLAAPGLQVFFITAPIFRYYCSGGGYILSRDVIFMMRQLPSSVHNVPFRPEDAYSGYLVIKTRKLLGYEVKRECVKKLSLFYYTCGRFDNWFYHRASTVNRHVSLHERMKRNDTVECGNSL